MSVLTRLSENREILQIFDNINCTDFKNLDQKIRADCCNLLESLCIMEIDNNHIFHSIRQSTEIEDRKNKIDGSVLTFDGREKKFQFKVKLPTEHDMDKSSKLVFEISKNIINPDDIKNIEFNGRDYISEASIYIGLSSDFSKISFYDFNHIKVIALKYTKILLDSGKKIIYGDYGCVRFTTEYINGKMYHKIMYFADKKYFRKMYSDLNFDVTKIISKLPKYKTIV